MENREKEQESPPADSFGPPCSHESHVKRTKE